MYSSLKVSASLKAESITFCKAADMFGWADSPETLGSRPISALASLSNFSGPAPIRRSTGATTPSLSSSSAARRWIGSSSGFPFSVASSLARCTASCDFTVNFSQRIAINIPYLNSMPELPAKKEAHHRGHRGTQRKATQQLKNNGREKRK